MQLSKRSPLGRFEQGNRETMTKFETVPIAELKTRLPAKLLPLVEEFKGEAGEALRRPGRAAHVGEGRRPEGSPEGSQGRGGVAQSPDPVPLPWRGGSGQLLSREDPGTEGEGGGGCGADRQEAGKAEEGRIVAH